MTYEECLDYIRSKDKFSVELGLERVREFCRVLGEPQDSLRCIHVAGTNGKGSTSLLIANILGRAGYKVGHYISPSVHCFEERISVNGKCIGREVFVRLVSGMVALDNGVSEFEFVTALAFLYFAEEECDYVVLEVGLGGRLDATNIIKSPKVCVLTLIDLDHTEYLGDTIEKIAYEKCGIVKEGSTVVSYPRQAEGAHGVIREVAEQRGAVLVDAPACEVVTMDVGGTVFRYGKEEYELSLLGRHQVDNASTAITAVKALGERRVEGEHIREALANSYFPCRFEIVRKNPYVILDGAHNYSGVAALAGNLKEYFGGRKIAIVMGMLRDKEYSKCVGEIAPLAEVFIATEPCSPRALRAEVLRGIADLYCDKTFSFDDRFEAVRFALGLDCDVVCVCGSLYLMQGLPDFIETCL